MVLRKPGSLVYPEPPEVTVMAVTKPAVTVAAAVAGSPPRHRTASIQSNPPQSRTPTS